MVEKEDLELDFDMFEPTVSAFAELFSEREKMKVRGIFILGMQRLCTFSGKVFWHSRI